jgi:hypothetical protein
MALNLKLCEGRDKITDLIHSYILPEQVCSMKGKHDLREIVFHITVQLCFTFSHTKDMGTCLCVYACTILHKR